MKQVEWTKSQFGNNVIYTGIARCGIEMVIRDSTTREGHPWCLILRDLDDTRAGAVIGYYQDLETAQSAGFSFSNYWLSAEDNEQEVVTNK